MLFLFVFYLPFGTVLAGGDLLGALGRMQSALQNLNYYGTLVFLQGGDVQSMSLVHKVDENGEYERIVNLNGSPREVIRNNDVVTCYLPDSKSVTVGKQHRGKGWLSKLIANDYAALQEFYDFELEGEDRVAGFITQRVLIRPKDRYRYGYRLWLDKDTSLLLKSGLLSEEGEPLEQVMFAEVSLVEHIPASMLTPAADGEGFTRYEENDSAIAVAAGAEEWHVGRMPEGFRVASHTRHPLPDSSGLADHLVVTDGLASVSVYLEKLDAKEAGFEGPSSRGAINIFGAVAAGHQVVVVGEVPAATVEMIATSVSWQTPGTDND